MNLFITFKEKLYMRLQLTIIFTFVLLVTSAFVSMTQAYTTHNQENTQALKSS